MKKSLMLTVLFSLAAVVLMAQNRYLCRYDVDPLSTAQARAVRGSQTCAQANLVSVWVCEGAIVAPCANTWYGTCCGTCRDGCTGSSIMPRRIWELALGVTPARSLAERLGLERRTM